MNDPTTKTPTPAWATWITPKAAATRLNLSSRTIRRHLAAGRITGKNVSTGTQARYVVDPDSLANVARPAANN